MAILRVFLKHSLFKQVNPFGFKVREIRHQRPLIFFLAPIKSLIHSLGRQLTDKFQNLTILSLTSDVFIQSLDKQLDQADVVILTPEKLDFMVRRWIDRQHIFKRVQLLILDEIHLIDCKERGRKLESAVGRLRLIKESINQAQLLHQKAVQSTETPKIGKSINKK